MNNIFVLCSLLVRCPLKAHKNRYLFVFDLCILKWKRKEIMQNRHQSVKNDDERGYEGSENMHILYISS